MSTLLVKDIPEQLYRDYKAACAKHGTTIRAEIIRHMQKEVAKLEK